MDIQFASTTLSIISENPRNPWVSTLSSSFAGAFFAFLFIKIGESLTRIGKRKKRSYDALVSLDHLGNENFSIVWDNIFVAKDIVDTISEAISKKELLINFNDFNTILIKNDILIDLLNIEFINTCFSLNVSSRKINGSLESISSFYQQMNQGIFQKTLPIETYFENLENLKERLEKMK